MCNAGRAIDDYAAASAVGVTRAYDASELARRSGLSYIHVYVCVNTTGAEMANKRMSAELLDLVAEHFKALSDRARLSLLQELRSGPLTVNELAALTEMGQANVSRHLSVLFSNHLVKRERDGVFVRYELADANVLKLCDLVCGRLENEITERRKVIAGR